MYFSLRSLNTVSHLLVITGIGLATLFVLAALTLEVLRLRRRLARLTTTTMRSPLAMCSPTLQAPPYVAAYTRIHTDEEAADAGSKRRLLTMEKENSVESSAEEDY